MLENISDYLSFIVLIAISLFSIRVFIGILFQKDGSDPISSEIQSLLRYSENEDD